MCVIGSGRPFACSRIIKANDDDDNDNDDDNDDLVTHHP